MNRDKGIIFDIQRFSLVDGPGIRTTVFLKGCSLRCSWCHNPESQSFKPQLSFNSEKCINCLECLKACPDGAHKQENGKHFLDWSLCSTSAKCVNVCSPGALKIMGHTEYVEQIVTEVLKDKNYYNRTGGGVTVSGGEPLSQPEFTLQLLKEFKKYGLHTVIDTCGAVKEKSYRDILPYTDLFLFDYKITSGSEHKKYTGAGNELILSNLDFLYKNNAAIILRCPVIPGINDNEEHFYRIKKIMRQYPAIKSVELMPYHNMGRGKAERIGLAYAFPELKTTDEKTRQEWLSYFLHDGYKVTCN
jgi:pyruvate formate lyase activating enzyme